MGTVLGLHRADEGVPESRAGCEWKAMGRRDAEMQRGGPSQACVALGHRAVCWGPAVLSQVAEPQLNSMRSPHHQPQVLRVLGTWGGALLSSLSLACEAAARLQLWSWGVWLESTLGNGNGQHRPAAA